MNLSTIDYFPGFKVMGDYNKPNKEKEWNRLEIRSLTAVVLDGIRRRILTGDFRPGERINESEIALNLGISRSPVREALRVLEGEGLITTLARKGSFITSISAEDVEELFGIRELLECHAIDCIKKRAKKSPDDLEALIEEIERELLKKPDIFTVISGFHFNLVELSDNYRLIELYRILGISLRRYQLIYHSIEGQRDVSMEHHQAIVVALKRGNYSDIKKLLKRHIRYVENTVKKQIKEILSD
ncbi:MAG: GntR family transcriptional regulator [Deltaproteobacteria bacterium]|nr:GntR family transcriptional regulator [Deltaproteobacteria bacterium]MBW2341416.1 GntR family transcriptional regulator [Deltaproteobacteria bacterium]